LARPRMILEAMMSNSAGQMSTSFSRMSKRLAALGDFPLFGNFTNG